MVKKLTVNFNGITMAYIMGFVNAALQLLLAFGVNLSVDEQAAIVSFINAAMIVIAHLGHRLGETYATAPAAVIVPTAAPPAVQP